MQYQFEQVDVFTTKLFAGNPLAVFTDGTGLTHDQMQLIAREMNLSETTFVVPSTRPECVARYHIFTPGQELPFAGHPTLGTAYVLARSGRVPKGATSFNMEAKVGAVLVRIEGPASDPKAIFFTSPEVRFGRMYENRSQIAAALNVGEAGLLPGAPIQQAGCPVFFLYIGLKTPEVVDSVIMNQAAISPLLGDVESSGIYVFAPTGATNQFYSRMLGFEHVGVVEDPATGSAASPLGAYLVHHGLVKGDAKIEMTINQGVKMGRPSLLTVHVQRSGSAVNRIEVGGSVVPVLQGTLTA
ncbi:MAG TPA: PhzF family phenazine biosynthesis protein [Candidatus Acidoferrales bacterium]|nr:PhzF family phenazine biosynthesis protein [Candidatus Acidoferrales bacterium]